MNFTANIGTSVGVSGPGVVIVQNKVNITIIQQAGWGGPSPNKAYTPPPDMPSRGSSTAKRPGEASSGGGRRAARGITQSSSITSKGKEATSTGGTDPNARTPSPGDMQLVPVHQAQPPRQYPLAAIRAKLGGDVQRICYVLNLLLSKSAPLQGYLPFRDDDLFEKLENGVVLCLMANLLQPGTINEKTIAILPPKKGSPMEISKNINLALMSLNMLGVSLGNPEDEIDANLLYHQSALHLIAILLQWIRLITVGRMNLRHSPQLAYTLEDPSDRGEITALHALPPEDLLLRWVNYQLWKSGKGLVMTSFDPRNDDSTIYAFVLFAVAPLEKRPAMIPPQTIIDETDPTKRAVMVVKNATVLGLGEITGPELILPITSSNNDEDEKSGALMRSSMLRPVLLSQAFAKYPNIAKPAGSKQEDENALFEELKHSNREGASEELLAMWINSFGPSSPIALLNEDLRSGIILLQVLEVMYPGCVNWSKVNIRSYPKLDPKQLENSSYRERVTDARRKFHWLSNCSLVMEIVELNKLKVNCSANDIATGEMKNTLALVFVMMLRYNQIWRQKLLGGETKEPTDQELVQWFNERLVAYSSSFQIKNINDPALRNTNALGFVGERLLAVGPCCRLCESCQAAAQKWAAGSGPAPVALAGVAQELEKSKSQSSSQPKPFRSNSNVENQASSTTDVPDAESNIKSSSNVEDQSSSINEVPDAESNIKSSSNVENQTSSFIEEMDAESNIQVSSNVENQTSAITELPDAESNIQSSSNVENQTSAITELPDAESNIQSSSNVENQTSAITELPDAEYNIQSSSNVENQTSAITELPHAESNILSSSNIENQTSAITELLDLDAESNIQSSSNVENQTSGIIDQPDSMSNFMSNSNVENQASGTDDLGSSNALSAWHFESVKQLSGQEIETCSYTTIALLRQGGVRVYTSKLGPNCDVMVYRSLLLQLNTIATKKRQNIPLNKSVG